MDKTLFQSQKNVPHINSYNTAFRKVHFETRSYLEAFEDQLYRLGIYRRNSSMNNSLLSKMTKSLFRRCFNVDKRIQT